MRVYLHSVVLPYSPIGCLFQLERVSKQHIEITTEAGSPQDLFLQLQFPRYFNDSVYSFAYHSFDPFLVFEPVLTQTLSNYGSFMKHLEKITKHKNVLQSLNKDQSVQYARDQFDIDIPAVRQITNRQYFAELFK